MDINGIYWPTNFHETYREAYGLGEVFINKNKTESY